MTNPSPYPREEGGEGGGRRGRREVVVVVKRLQGAAGRSGWAQLSPAVRRDCSPVSAVAVTDWRGETMGQ